MIVRPFQSYRPAVLLVAVALAFIGAAIVIERQTISRLLYDDAVSTGREWTEFLAKNVGNIGDVASGGAPTVEALAFLDNVKTVGRVFLFKIYDAEGRPRYVSDDLPEEEGDEADLAEHNPEALEAIEAGNPEIEIKQGDAPSRPAFFSEAYIPIIGKDGKVSGVVEAYIDQTEKQAQFSRVAMIGAALLALLIAAAFGLPSVAWYVRKRDQDQAHARIHYLANFDSLSGLANRTRLAEELTIAIGEALPARRLLAVHCIDIDHFKDINDRLGLKAGDLMIKIAAERLQSVADPKDIVARLAGDEFVVVQKDARDRADAEVFAHKIAQAMGAAVQLGGEQLLLTVGIGVAIFPDHGNDAERLIRGAELALLKGKSEGRGRLHFFSPELDRELTARLAIERSIDAALTNGSFALHYQPLYAEPGETLVGFEALARLPTDDGGFISPAEFIPAAERMGAINRLGAWVLREACATAANWPEHLTISVNLSPAQFGHDTIAEVVADALAESGLKPNRLLLEITESLLLKDSAGVMTELARLKALGAAIVMDDFGTGYSSLAYLWRFPYDKIKIDGSFMRAFDSPGAPAEKIVRTIAALGHALGMQVCVEGVETERHAAYARSSGCDEVQGYHFGRPMPVTSIAATILADFRRNAEIEEDAENMRVMSA